MIMGKTSQVDESLIAKSVEIEGDSEDVNTYFLENGWSDGLPVVPPTRPRVDAMIEASGRNRLDVLGRVAPSWGIATVEKVAINATMAGCRPDYFPVVLAAVEAVIEEPFDLYGVQATTNPVAPLIVVNGPISRKIGLNSGYNAFGQGWRANATIGRALRLVLLNIGGGKPGLMDRATQGHPGKYSFCVAENEAETPWDPFHVEHGFASGANVVTVYGAAAFINILDHTSRTATGLLNMIGHSMTASGNNHPLFAGVALLALCPEHARILSTESYSKADVRQELFGHARVPRAHLSPECLDLIRRMRPDQFIDENRDIDVLDRPEDLWITVTGGGGPHSSFIPGYGSSVQPIIREIRSKAAV
jgi:hypothetical protein